MGTLARWLPALTLMLVSIISYVDRNTLALLAPSILEQTHMSAAQYGWAVSSYSIAFALANPLWGRILDRVGLRLGMSLAVALWSLASAAHGLASGFLSFALARGVLGLGEGAAAPGGLRVVTQTLPPANRARGIALTYSGGSAGAILTPIVITPIAAWLGWRGAFGFTFAVGVAWIAGFLLLARRADLRQPFSAREQSAPVASRPHLGDLRVVAFLIGYALGALPLGFVVYCSALYLHKVLGLPQVTLGKVLWLPPLGSELGVFFWGYLADKRRRHDGSSRSARNLLPAALLLSSGLVLVPYTHAVPLVLALFFAAMFAAAAFQVLMVTYASEAFPADHAGYVAGLGSGAYGAGLFALMPLFGHLFDGARYPLAFALAALCPVLGYGAFMTLSRSSPPALAETRELE